MLYNASLSLIKHCNETKNTKTSDLDNTFSTKSHLTENDKLRKDPVTLSQIAIFFNDMSFRANNGSGNKLVTH